MRRHLKMAIAITMASLFALMFVVDAAGAAVAMLD
jgi:hypothetical protein